MDNSIKLGGLWKAKTKGGKDYLSGMFTRTSRLLIFRNERKEKDSEPDYIAYLVPQEEQRTAPAQPQQPKKEDPDGF